MNWTFGCACRASVHSRGQRCLTANGPHIAVDKRTIITSVRGCGFGGDRLMYRRGCETKQVVPTQWHHVCYWQVDEELEKERRSGCTELRRKLPRSQTIPTEINVVEQEGMRPEVQDRMFLTSGCVAKSAWTCCVNTAKPTPEATESRGR